MPEVRNLVRKLALCTLAFDMTKLLLELRMLLFQDKNPRRKESYIADNLSRIDQAGIAHGILAYTPGWNKNRPGVRLRLYTLHCKLDDHKTTDIWGDTAFCYTSTSDLPSNSSLPSSSLPSIEDSKKSSN